MSLRQYQKYNYKQANFRICTDQFNIVTKTISKTYQNIEAHISAFPEFKSSLVPLKIQDNISPEIESMYKAGIITGIGPMSAVAGTVAMFSAQTALRNGASEVIIDNGGDIFLFSKNSIILGIFAGDNPISGKLSFKITADLMPLSVCSSSSKMGHSLSFGNCDLVTVFSKNASIADSTATAVCNKIHTPEDMKSVLNKALSFEEVLGIFAVCDDKIAAAGNIPELIKGHSITRSLVTFDKNSKDISLGHL